MTLYLLRLAMLLLWLLLGGVVALAWHGVGWQPFVVIVLGLDMVTWQYAEWDGVYASTDKRIMP